MQELIYKSRFGEYKVTLSIDQYKMDDSTCIQLWCDQGPFARLTVCLGTSQKGCSFLDTNNNPEALDFVKENKLGEETGNVDESGYCSYPEVKWDMDRIKQLI